MTQSQSCRTVKLSAKAREEVTQTTSYRDVSPTAERNSEVENLVLHLTELWNGWDAGKKREVQATQNKRDPIVILATTINSANVSNHNQFSFVSKLDVEKPETYTRAMQEPNATQWARAMEEELD